MYVYLLRGASPFNLGVARTLYKLPSRGLYRSPLKYMDKLSPNGQTLGAKTHKICCHLSILLWPLAFSVKIEQTNFCSPPITLLELLSTQPMVVV